MCLGKVGDDPSLAAIRGRKEGPVNWLGMARDVRRYWRVGIMANRRRAGRPSFRALLEDECSVLPAPLPHRLGGPGATKNGQMEETLSAIRARWMVFWRGSDWPLFHGPNHGWFQLVDRSRARRPSFRPLIAQIDCLFQTPFIDKGGNYV